MSNEVFIGVPGLPNGWGLLAIRKPIKDDWYLDGYGNICQWTSDETSSIIYDIIRKVEKSVRYRPFANAEEFKPHRDRWWRIKDDATVYPPQHYNDRGYCGCHWRKAFECRVFDDGTPFGVLCND